jgi:nucleotide-binding universal stress UspA family protein
MTSPAISVQFKNILVPVDFSSRSEAAGKLAAAIVQAHGSTVHLANVIESFESTGMPVGHRHKLDEEHALRDFASLESRCFSRICHERVLLDGDVNAALASAIREREIDLVVMATHGVEGCERLLLGSITEELFRTVKCPVLSLGPYVGDDVSRFASFHKILYPMEITPSSIAAVPYVAGLVDTCGARVTLLHVIHPDVQSPSERERFRLRFSSEMRESFPKAVLGSIDDVIVEFGSVPEVIVEFALARQADAIVLGVRSLGGFTRSATHIPWTIAHKIIDSAPCPVLTVRHHGPEKHR